MPGAKRKLSDEFCRLGNIWQVSLADGTLEAYESELDALRARDRARQEVELLRRLNVLMGMWGSQLKKAARSKGACFGSVAVQKLAPLPENLLDTLVEQASHS
jgi:hypothetical protein